MSQQRNEIMAETLKAAPEVDFTSVPLSEYPRPNLVRRSYYCLNGGWDYALSPHADLPKSYGGKILVPYAIESVLSGVGYAMQPNDFLFYHRIISIPSEMTFEEKLLLHFDGIDQTARIFINGTFLMEHVGAYTPFTVMVPETITGSFDLVVQVQDATDASYHARGKQTLHPDKGWFYTSSSGIFRSVWMEVVPKEDIQAVSFYPDYDNHAVKILVTAASSHSCSAFLEDREVFFLTNEMTEIPLLSFHPWSPEDPYLYDVRIRMGEDEITSYFGVRKIAITDVAGVKRIFLNDKPIFLTGLLDQGYYFQGNLTPRSNDDYAEDIAAAKHLGFNVLRVHVVIESPVFYAEADRRGMLLIQDFPNGGSAYRFLPTILPRFFSFLSEKNISYRKLGRESKAGRDEAEAEFIQYLSLLNNYPSIIIDTIFNEGWGEFDSSRIYHRLKALEHQRLFDTASGWYDADSDFYSIHTYSFPNLPRKDKRHRPFLLTEIGGMSYRVPNHSYFPGCFGHGTAKTPEELTAAYQHLYQKKIIPQIHHRGLCGVIYTEFSDCEREYNGLFTYDRSVLKINPNVLQTINQDLKDALKKE